jgi:hypothetical protein
VSHFQAEGEEVRVDFTGAAPSASVELLVCADGIGSPARRRLLRGTSLGGEVGGAVYACASRFAFSIFMPLLVAGLMNPPRISGNIAPVKPDGFGKSSVRSILVASP